MSAAIVANYNKTCAVNAPAHIEFEAKFGNISAKTAATLVSRYGSGAKFTQILDAITTILPGENHIRSIEFRAGEKVSDIYRKKKRIGRTQDINNGEIRISLARETSSEPFTSRATVFRFKNRISCPIGDKWQLDITWVANIKDIGQVNKMKDAAFIKINSVDALLAANLGPQWSIELELEYIAADCKMSIKDLTAIEQIYQELQAVQSDKPEEFMRLLAYVDRRVSNDQRKRAPTTLKEFLPAVQTLTKNVYINQVYPPEEYIISEKVDGDIAILIANNRETKIIMDAGNTVITATGTVDGETILVGEYCTVGSAGLFVVFDALLVLNNLLVEQPYVDRIAALESVKQVKFGISIAYKTLALTSTERLEEHIKQTYNAEYRYKIDGLIFSRATARFFDREVTYKWKDSNTIDFLVLECPQDAYNSRPYLERRDNCTLYILCVGISYKLYEILGMKQLFPDIMKSGDGRDDYFPVQFSPSDSPLAFLYWHPVAHPIGPLGGKIVEFDRVNGAWQPMRVRTDRSVEAGQYGNDFRIAEDNWQNYINKFDLSELWSPVDSSVYFAQAKDSIYHAPTAYNSFIKSRLIGEASGSAYVLDIASGKGQDLMRYFQARVGTAIFTDRDPVALAELVRRKNTVLRTMAKKKQEFHPMRIHIAQMDFLQPARDNIELLRANFDLPPAGIQFIACNFAIHYFLETSETAANLIDFVDKLLAPGGKFAFTCFDGERIFNLLRSVPLGEAWSSEQDDVVKFRIRKLYKSAKLEAYGQKIGVKLPFSRGEEYSEFLVNIKNLATQLAKRGIKLVRAANFGEYFGDFARENHKINTQLTDADREYISLHTLVVFEKKVQKK